MKNQDISPDLKPRLQKAVGYLNNINALGKYEKRASRRIVQRLNEGMDTTRQDDKAINTILELYEAMTAR